MHVEEARECHTVARGIKVKEQETPKGATAGAGHMALIAPSSRMSEPLILRACLVSRVPSVWMNNLAVFLGIHCGRILTGSQLWINHYHNITSYLTRTQMNSVCLHEGKKSVFCCSGLVEVS